MASQATLAKNKTSKEWAASAQKTIWETSQIFHRATIGLSSFDKDINPQLVALSKSTAKVAGAFGVFGAMFSIIMALVPGGDSPEFKLMKVEFGKLSEKVDTIARSLDATKNLIQVETQKAAYLKYENNIHNGFSQLQECLKNLGKTELTCSSPQECRRVKLRVAEGFIKSMDVQKSINAILRGVTSDSTFGKSLLDLLKEESECNVPKINLFANKVTALITKGVTVLIFHDLLTKVNYNVMDGTVLGDKMLRIIEKRRQDVQERCFDNIDYWMPLDVRNSHEKFTSDIQATNTQLLKTLKTKYPWIFWHVLTYGGENGPVTGPRGSRRRLLYSSSKKQKVHTFVIPTNAAEVENMSKKLKEWKRITGTIDDSWSTAGQNIENQLKDDLILEDQIQSFAVLPGTKWILGYYNNEIKQLTLGTDDVTSANVFVNRPKQGFVIAVSFIQGGNPAKCTDPCSKRGKCFVFPYSQTTGCRCASGYTGEKCESAGTSLKLKFSISSLVQNTMKLPTFASIQHSIEDTQLNLKMSTEDIKNSIIKLGAKIDKQFKSLGEFMSRKFDWFYVLQKYKDAIENLNYFHSISSEKLVDSTKDKNIDFSKLPSNTKRGRFAMYEDKDIAKFLLSPTGIQKWLYQINFLIVGRRDSEFNSHKPLLFMVMEKYKDRLCLQGYKEEITRTYRQLMLLQLQGYMLWSNAYSIVNRDSSVISDRYKTLLENQRKFLQGATCTAKIPHSINFQDCTGGYFIHKTMGNIAVQCDVAYFSPGKNVFIKIFK